MSSVSSIAPFLLPIVVLAASPATNTGRTVERLTAGSRSELGSSDDTTQPVRLNNWRELREVATSTSSTASVLVSNGLTEARQAGWRDDVVSRLQGYEGVCDGWKGPGSLAPEARAISLAIELADQFALEMPNLPRPLVSGDDDGSICFFWNDGIMMATVSVFGDGTYAYYAEGYDDPVRSDGDVIGVPLKSALIAAMTGTTSPRLIAA